MFCARCGEPGVHDECRRALELEPPRYCAQCRRRMVVQVTPTGWTARCVEHGELAGGGEAPAVPAGARRSPYDVLTSYERSILASGAFASTPLAQRIRSKLVWPEPKRIGVLDHEDRPASGIVLTPPPDGAAPAIDGAQAYRIAGMGDQYRGPTIMLALAAVERHGPVTIDNRLVQAVRWDDKLFATSGPAPARGEPLRDRHALGTALVLVDAMTGEVLVNMLTGRRVGQ